MDIGTGLTVLGTALGGKDIIIKMLGPTADYVGNGIKDFASKRVENIQNIFLNASKKLGNKIEIDGGIHPKVLQGTLNEGSYANDSLSIEYFGGVLASSRSGISRDDRGAFFISLISRLSTYQLRLHYIFYHAIKQNFDGDDVNWSISGNRGKLRLYFPFTAYENCMDFIKEEKEKGGILFDHSINGLIREELIDPWFQSGSVEHLMPYLPTIIEPGFILQPNRLGFELFYWAYGKGQENPRDFLQKDVVFDIDQSIILDNCIKKLEN
jgi:hypothetical protein